MNVIPQITGGIEERGQRIDGIIYITRKLRNITRISLHRARMAFTTVGFCFRFIRIARPIQT